MTQIPWRRSSVQLRRSLLGGATATAIGLALWGTARTTEPMTGEGPRTIAEVVIADADAIDAGPRTSIEFPERAVSANAPAGLFSEHSWYVPPPSPPPAKPVPPPPPVAPPLPYSFMGVYATSGGGAVYYLVKGEQVYDVKIGDRLEGMYSVDALQDDQLLLTYLPLNQQQAVSLRR